MLTERQAWLKIAKACDEANDFGWFSVEGCRFCGLCTAISRLDISDGTAARMERKIRSTWPSERKRYAFRWTVDKTGATQRAAFCRKMARLCKPAKRKAKAR